MFHVILVMSQHPGGVNSFDTPPKFNSSPLKNDGWKTTFILGWYIFRGALLFLDSLCLPLYPCPDAAHAEADPLLVSWSKAITRQLSTSWPTRANFGVPTSNKPWKEANHLLVFRLPPYIWSYTPREFNKCADFLAGINILILTLAPPQSKHWLDMEKVPVTPGANFVEHIFIQR